MGTVTNLHWARIARHLAPAGSPPTAENILSFMAPPDTEADPGNLRPDYWAIKSSGNVQKDFEIGRACADEFLEFVGMCPNERNSGLLCDIVGDMVGKAKRGKRLDGIQIAFLIRISKVVKAAAAFQQGVRFDDT